MPLRLSGRRAAVVAALVAAAGTGCVFGGSKPAAKPLTETHLAELVVLPGDVEAALADSPLTQFDSGRLTANDAVAGPREDPGRFGRRAGWKARYRRTDPSAKGGVLVVESRVDEFADATGAFSDIDAYRSELQQTAPVRGGRLLPSVTVIGAKGVASSYEQKALGGTVGYHTVAWRHGRLTASVTVSGFAGTSIDDALALARQVQQRIAAVA
jgi:hypothetical protein